MPRKKSKEPELEQRSSDIFTAQQSITHGQTIIQDGLVDADRREAAEKADDITLYTYLKGRMLITSDGVTSDDIHLGGMLKRNDDGVKVEVTMSIVFQENLWTYI